MPLDPAVRLGAVAGRLAAADDRGAVGGMARVRGGGGQAGGTPGDGRLAKQEQRGKAGTETGTNES